MKSNEIWKMIPDFHDLYEISNMGRCRRGGRILKGSKDSSGYIQFDMTHKGERKQMLAHRAVANAFIETDGTKETVNHKDGDKLNNCSDNLEFVSHADNMRHAWREGLVKSRKHIAAYNPEGKLHYKFHGLHMVEHAGFSESSVGKYLRGVIKKKPGGYHFEEIM